MGPEGSRSIWGLHGSSGMQRVCTRSLDQTMLYLISRVQVDGLRSLDRVLFYQLGKLFSISSGHFAVRQLQYYPRSVFLERCPEDTHLKELRGAH